MPRPSLVTSSGPSPVRGFIAAMRAPLPSVGVERRHRAGNRWRRRCGDAPSARIAVCIAPHYSRSRARAVHHTADSTLVHARSALFDLYGDHLRARGARAPVAALVRLLAPLGVHPPAVRTAVSRMVRQGWLEPTRIEGQPGYALSARARRRLDDAAARIYRTGNGGWDQHWHLGILREVPNARRREQLASQLAFLGWAPLSDSAWVGLRNDAEVEQILEVEGIAADRFRAPIDEGAVEFARRVWKLDELGASYDAWLIEAKALVDGAGPETTNGITDEQAFAVRSELVHE